MKIRRSIRMIGAAGVLGSLGLALDGFGGPVPRHDGPPNGHFDGERFFNSPRFDKGLGAFIKWQTHRDRGEWKTDLSPHGAPPPPAAVPPGSTRVTWINHATVLIQVSGLNVLTDPIWSERASPWNSIGPARHLAPGIVFDDLPPIHAVLLSHNHFDHMDLATLERLAARDDPEFFLPLGNCVYLQEFAREKCREFDWWDRASVGEVSITAVPARHWSRRGLFDTNRALWSGWVVEGPRRIYFAGDTGAGDHFAQIRERLGAPHLAILPIGAYLPRWFMADQHLSPADAVQAARTLGAGEAMAMHHGTFELADDGQWQALEALEQALGREDGGSIPPFWRPGHGDARQWPPEPSEAGQ